MPWPPVGLRRLFPSRVRSRTLNRDIPPPVRVPVSLAKPSDSRIALFAPGMSLSTVASPPEPRRWTREWRVSRRVRYVPGGKKTVPPAERTASIACWIPAVSSAVPLPTAPCSRTFTPVSLVVTADRDVAPLIAAPVVTAPIATAPAPTAAAPPRARRARRDAAAVQSGLSPAIGDQPPPRSGRALWMQSIRDLRRAEVEDDRVRPVLAGDPETVNGRGEGPRRGFRVVRGIRRLGRVGVSEHEHGADAQSAQVVHTRRV